MTLTALRPRPYQREALDKVAQDIREGVLRPVVLMPTGGGKGVVIANQVLEHLAANPDGRVLVIVHTNELVQQLAKAVTDAWPAAPVGIVKAAANEVDARVIVGSVQTLRNPGRRAQIVGVTLGIVDECHHAEAATYKAVMGAWDCPWVGYTATLMRGDGKSLFPTWQRVSFSRTIGWMVRKGYLVPPRGRSVEVPDLDLANIRQTRADYRDGDLGEALAESLAPELVAAAYLEHAADRRGILFAPTVASAQVFADALNLAGVKSEVIHGGLGDDERAAVLDRHRAGVTQVLCNCMILTEGYDDPTISCVVIARPTKSKGLYIQMAGRGLRVDLTLPYEGQDCLLLDVVGASDMHDLCSLADLSERTFSAKDAHSGRTLVELEDDLDAGEGVLLDETPYWRGPTVSREFDPLGRPSTKVWLRTKGGTFFVPAGRTAYVFIMEYPARGQWSVAWCGKTNMDRPVEGDRRPVGMTVHRGLPLEEALVWAEDLAVDMGADLNTADKKAPWRKRVPSEKMLGLARTLGIKIKGHTTDAGLFVPDVRQGELSDEITIVIGTRRIDALVKAVHGKEK